MKKGFFNPLLTKLYLSDFKTELVPRSKHSALVIETDKWVICAK